MLLNFIWVAVLLLFNHLDSLPKLYYKQLCTDREKPQREIGTGIWKARERERERRYKEREKIQSKRR